MSNRVFRVAAAIAVVVLTGLTTPPPVQGQQAGPRSGTVTLMSLAPGAKIAVKGSSTYTGASPVELPQCWNRQPL